MLTKSLVFNLIVVFVFTCAVMVLWVVLAADIPPDSTQRIMNTYGAHLFTSTTLPRSSDVFPWVFIPVMLINTIFGVVTYNLARKKGYEKYFWTGFFLSHWGYFYVSKLPYNE